MKSIHFLPFLFAILFCSSCKNEEPTPTDPPAEYQIITIEDDWYDISYIDPKAYIIEEPRSSQGNVSYLVLGDDKAIMFDTGSGENSSQNGLKIKHITDQLTNLPTTLLLSHFHFDHNQNIAEFETVGFPDLPFLRQQTNQNIYEFTAEDLFLGTTPEQTEVDEWLPVNTDIDLGGKIIQLLNVPGHSDESVAIIDKTNKVAFLGDYLYNGPLFVFSNDDLIPYKESIEHLISILDSDYRLFGAHGSPKIAFEKLERLLNFINCIESGDCAPTTGTSFGKEVWKYNFEGMSIWVFQE